MLIDRDKSQLLVIDVQKRLLPAIPGADMLVEACRRLLVAAGRLSVPSLVSEQYVTGLGRTPAELLALADGEMVFEKLSFSCLGQVELASHLLDPCRPQVILCGAEAHVCITQTAVELLNAGRAVFVAADAVASREPPIKALALDRLRGLGAQIVSVEMVVFEWLREADTPDFRAVAPLMRAPLFERKVEA